MTLKEMHHPDEAKRILLAGKADHAHTDNSVSTAKYTLLTFLPIVSIIFSNTSCGCCVLRSIESDASCAMDHCAPGPGPQFAL